MQIFQMICHSKILFPKNFDEATKSIIKHLTDHDLSRRYGCLKGGVDDIKNHRFFNTIDWTTLPTMKKTAPHVPELIVPSKVVNIAVGEKGISHEKIPEARDPSNRAIPGPIDPFFAWF